MKLKLFISLIFMIIVGMVSYLFLQWANSPVRQTVGTAVSPVAKEVSTQDIATDYYATRIPADYRVESATDPKNPDRAQLTAFEAKSGKIQIGITSAALPSGGLSDVADYNFRIKEIGLYDRVASTHFSVDSVTFQAKTGEETTTFLTQGARYASVSISGQAVTSQELVAIRKLVADYWRWL